MDHGKGDRERPIVHLLIQNVLVVDDDGEAEEDPYRNVRIRKENFLQNILGDGSAFPHFRPN